MKNLKRRGISLIVLVVTIIVIIILATAVIQSFSKNNPLEKAKEATFKSDVRTIENELELLKASNYLENNGENYNNPETKEPIKISELTSVNDNYKEKLVVNNGELRYRESKLTDTEKVWVKEIGLNPGGYLLTNNVDGVKIENGTLTTDEWFYLGAPDEIKQLNDIIIPETVTSIGNYVFWELSSLENIIIPESVESIGTSAFYGCSALKYITIPQKVNQIDGNAFASCSSLKSIVIPNGVTSIDTQTFYGCTSLENIVIPESVTWIGVRAFCDCNSLKEISLPVNLKRIGEYAFYNCSSLKEISVSANVNEIEQDAFYGCTSLKNIYLEAGSKLDPANAENWGIDTSKCTVTKLT